MTHTPGPWSVIVAACAYLWRDTDDDGFGEP